MWKNLFASRVFILIGTLALAVIVFLIYLRIAPRGQDIYLPGPTSVQTVYVPKWAKPGKTEVRIVPVNARIQFFDRESVVKESKIQDAPDNIIALGQVPPHGGKTTVFATLKPGADNVLRGGLEYRQEPMSFWELKREIHGGVYYGIAGQNIAEAQARINFLRTGPANWQAQGRVGLESKGKMNGALLIGVEF